MLRRKFVQACLIATAWLVAGGHTPYRQWQVYRRRHLLIGTSKADAPTWPVQWEGRATIPLIQIDQVLAGRNWAIESLRTSPDLGSDHRGLVADLCRLGYPSPRLSVRVAGTGRPLSV